MMLLSLLFFLGYTLVYSLLEQFHEAQCSTPRYHAFPIVVFLLEAAPTIVLHSTPAPPACLAEHT
ncbi:MAG: hypothetical protein JNN25_17165 [Candidatus Kapabacteria bacterium]|nr:hypothetical protein [Candidatus Kapabacteria bacterium]